jgi:hypothetical protein
MLKDRSWQSKWFDVAALDACLDFLKDRNKKLSDIGQHTSIQLKEVLVELQALRIIAWKLEKNSRHLHASLIVDTIIKTSRELSTIYTQQLKYTLSVTKK